MHISRDGGREVFRKIFASEAWCEFVLELVTYTRFNFYSSVNAV
jgi:hypothetical protein